MNIIKISVQKDHIIIVNEKEKRNIKGISTSEIVIKNQTFNEKFDDYPTLETSILGIAFLKTNKDTIDMKTEKLIIPEPIYY